MAVMPPDDNPFAPPQATIGVRESEIDFDVDTNAELIRRHHLSHESSIKSVGLLCYLAAMLGIVSSFWGVLAATGTIKGNQPFPGYSDEMMRIILWIGAAFWAIVAVLGAFMGYGLRHLQVWVRWTSMVLLVLSLLYSLGVSLFLMAFFSNGNTTPLIVVMLVGIMIQGYIFYLLVAPKSNVVFSAEYRMVIAKTSEIRCRTSLIVKIVLGLLVTLLVLALIGMIATSFNG